MDIKVETPSPQGLVTQFESLGHDCEFGLFQRQAGAEPLGLIRFTAHKLPALRRALRNRFEELTEDVTLYVNDAGHYMTYARRVEFHFHTFQPATEIDADELLSREIKRLKFLRRKMIEDLEAGEKIFIRRSHETLSQEEVHGLLSDITAYGPNTLLWVDVPDDDQLHGRLEVEQPNLLRGYLRMRPNNPHVFTFDYSSWMKLCRSAHRARLGLPFNFGAKTGESPAEPIRSVRAANAHWDADLALGSNGRVLHVQHRSLGDYYQSEDVLHVRWDIWESELFMERGGVFRAVKTLGVTD